MHCRLDFLFRAGDVPDAYFVYLPGKGKAFFFTPPADAKGELADMDVLPEISVRNFSAVDEYSHNAALSVNNPSHMIPGV